MVSAELLAELGLAPEDIEEFFRLEADKQYIKQERLLRKYRNVYLDSCHECEKCICELDYILHEIKNMQKGKTRAAKSAPAAEFRAGAEGQGAKKSENGK